MLYGFGGGLAATGSAGFPAACRSGTVGGGIMAGIPGGLGGKEGMTANALGGMVGCFGG